MSGLSQAAEYVVQNADDVDDPTALKAVAEKRHTDEWPALVSDEKTAEGRQELLSKYADTADDLLHRYRSELDAISEGSLSFKADLNSKGTAVLWKDDDRMVIWGPASVEMVDKENDRITADALKAALPQLLRRKRLSYEHTDQLVGDILESHETEEPVEIEIDGHTYERSSFPTDVLTAKEDDVPEDGLYVAGEVWTDTNQGQEVKQGVEEGEIDSYSISGEAIETATKVADGELIEDISSMDLSAVTLCEEGMNPGAKFAVLAKSDGSETVRRLAKTAFGEIMENEDNDNDSETIDGLSKEEREALRDEFKEAAAEVLEEKDNSLTREDVEAIVEEKTSDVDPEIKAQAQKVAEETGMDQKAVQDALVQAADGDDDDEPPVDEDEMEDVVDVPEDDESPDEDEPEAPVEDDDEDDVEASEDSHNVDVEALKTQLPDDLFQAVSEHLADPGDGEIEMEDDGDDDDDVLDADNEEKEDDDTKEKSAESYAEQIVQDSLVGTETDLTKSWDDDDDEDDDEVELEKGETGGVDPLSSFAASVGDY